MNTLANHFEAHIHSLLEHFTSNVTIYTQPARPNFNPPASISPIPPQRQGEIGLHAAFQAQQAQIQELLERDRVRAQELRKLQEEVEAGRRVQYYNNISN